MTLRDAIKEIESHDLAARLNLGSDFRTFLRAAQQEESIQFLMQKLAFPEVHNEVIGRVLEIAKQRFDPRYECPWDTAFAVYLLLLDIRCSDSAKLVAQQILQTPQIWWARSVANRIIWGKHFHSDAGFEQFDATPLFPNHSVQAVDATEVILPAAFLPSPPLAHLREYAATFANELRSYAPTQELWFSPLQYTFKS